MRRSTGFAQRCAAGCGAALLVFGVCAGPVLADVFAPVEEPASGRLPGELAMTPRVDGDQLFFFFDARTPRVSFIGVSSLNDEDLLLDIKFLDVKLMELATIERTLPGGGHVLIDPTTIAGVEGHLGLVMVTPCDSATLRAVVPDIPLLGGFTLANTALGSGFGQNPFGRLAINRATGTRAEGGTIIGIGQGVNVAFQQIEPTVLSLPFYFDLANLSPPELDGNRVFLVAFCDVYDGSVGHTFFGVRPAPGFTFASVRFGSSAGDELALQNNAPAVGGVLATTLQALAAPVILQGAGKVVFTLPETDPDCRRNVFGLGSQSLGTFAVGQRLPGLPLNQDTLP